MLNEQNKSKKYIKLLYFVNCCLILYKFFCIQKQSFKDIEASFVNDDTSKSGSNSDSTKDVESKLKFL